MSAEGSANTVKKKRSTRNLVLRGLSALGALAALYLCLRWDATNYSGWAWAILTAAFSTLCLREYYRLAKAGDTHAFPLIGYVCGPLWILATEWDLSGGSEAYLAGSSAHVVFLLATVATMLLQMTRKTNENSLNNVASTLFGMIYCAILPGTLIHLRHLALNRYGWPMNGLEFVIVCIFVAKVSDVGALLTGSRWGKHKLIPRLSPGKTWEGFIGGLLFSVLLLQFMAWVEPRMALAALGRGHLLLLSVLLALGGLAGDLIESAFKRNSHRKDAGTGVPGFGGMLDLIDSLMVATPVMYFYLLACGAYYVQ